MRAVFGREIGQAEESLADLRGSAVAQRGVPSVDSSEPLQPVIVRTVQRHDVKPGLDQGDEGQEMFAVESILVELGRGAVAGGDDRQAMLLDQRGEQPAHDHRIGRIVDHHLVEGQHPQALGDASSDRRDRIAGLTLPRLAQPGVNLQHEGVEVDAALLGDCEALVEQVHQHRLAAPDPAPQVKPARGRGLFGE